MESGDSFAINYNQNQLPLTVGIVIFDRGLGCCGTF